jgi:large subunit ribosomal protein L4
MPTAAILNMSGKEVGTIELSDAIFGQKVNKDVLHEVVKAYLANQRQGTQSALTRAEVSGGGIKPWRQKGTGRARHGSTRSPQWRHGGVVFAPKPRDYRLSVNKKVKRLALKSAFSSKLQDSALIILDELAFPAIKTKDMVKTLEALKVERALIVTDAVDQTVVRSASNLQGVKTTTAGAINTYDILKYDTLILTKAALARIEEVYA